MKKINIIFICLAIALIVFVAAFFYIQHQKKNVLFSCNYDLIINTHDFSIKQKINLKLYKKTGLISSFGEIQIGDKKHIIDRDIIFNYEKHSDHYTMIYDKEIRKLNDNTPKKLWHEISPAAFKYNFTLYRIKGDILLVKEHKIPIITCTKR
ncbi:hypothetical protein ACQKDS_11145 [Serratia sp. NPDC078593]|uniref:hypothetical protein n=1 Tax=unclassified Serratia (in: enterobacteria) TaxID=2647522 RepID=UPI0037D71D4E